MCTEKKVISGFQVRDTELDIRDDTTVDVYVLDLNDEQVKVTINVHALVHASLNDDGVHLEVNDTCELFVTTEEAIWLLKEVNEQAYDGLKTIPTIFTKEDNQTLFTWLQFLLEMTYDAHKYAESEESWWDEMNSLNKLIDKLVYIGGVKEPDNMACTYWEARSIWWGKIIEQIKEVK